MSEEVASITGAGFESTAAVMRVILYHLYSNPDVLTRLRAELREAGGCQPSGSFPADLDWVKLQQLPYLTGVLHEGLRLSPALASRMARVAPDRDLFYDQWRIPKGTPVGMTTILMHYDEKLYPEPESFVPDRWVDLEVRKKADKTYAPFSRGTRNCLGMQ